MDFPGLGVFLLIALYTPDAAISPSFHEGHTAHPQSHRKLGTNPREKNTFHDGMNLLETSTRSTEKANVGGIRGGCEWSPWHISPTSPVSDSSLGRPGEYSRDRGRRCNELPHSVVVQTDRKGNGSHVSGITTTSTK